MNQFEEFPLAAVAGEDSRGPGQNGAGPDDLLQLPSAVGSLKKVGSGLVGDCVRSDHLVEDADGGDEFVLGGAVHGCIVLDGRRRVKPEGKI